MNEEWSDTIRRLAGPPKVGCYWAFTFQAWKPGESTDRFQVDFRNERERMIRVTWTIQSCGNTISEAFERLLGTAICQETVVCLGNEQFRDSVFGPILPAFSREISETDVQTWHSKYG